LATGDFSAQIVDTLGCFTSIDIFLAEPVEVQASIDADNLVGCSPFTVQFTNTSNAAANCEWDFGNGNTYTGCENVFNVYEEEGVYSVSLSVYDDNGCSNDVTYENFITVNETPIAGINVSPQILTPDDPSTNITNTSIGGNNFVWNLGDSPSQGFYEPGYYTYNPNIADTFFITLIAIGDNGCKDTAYSYVAFNNDPIIFIPNTFTPDGNNSNDIWIPVISSPQTVDLYDLQVYNRWGERIFETTDLSQGWDGTYKGNTVQDGTYTWMITVTYGQQVVRKSGHVTLLR